ncbi:MAG: hypothetical protein WA160_11360 [Pseudobdellovibrio sp.]
MKIMKKNLALMPVLICSFAMKAQADNQNFTADSKYGRPAGCPADARSLPADVYASNEYRKIVLEAQDNAQSKCELATKKLCGVISWGFRERNDCTNMAGDKASCCVGTATATTIP